MAIPQSVDDAKLSGLQLIVKALGKLLGPLTDSTQKDLRNEYFLSMGIEADDFEAGNLDQVDKFLAKKANEADLLSFAAALKQQTDIISNVGDVLERNIPFFSGQPFEKKRLIDDLTTSLLNMLTMEYVRVNLPLVHNILMALFSLNHFSNRGTGISSTGSLISEYAKSWSKSFDRENPDEARKLSEVFFVVGTVMAFLANRSLSNSMSAEDIETILLVGGQFGNELPRKTELTTTRDIINDLLGRTFEISISREKGNDKGEMTATFVMLSKEDVSSGVEVFIQDGYAQKNIPLSDNWFFSFDAAGKIHFLTGGNSTDSDVDVNSSRLSLAFERLVFARDIKPDQVELKTFFDYFQFAFGNLSLQLKAEPRDLTFTFITQVFYAISNKSMVDGKEVTAGFPLSHLPNIRNKADIPLRYSLKNGFGFDGGFIGERPPDLETPSPSPSLARTGAPAATSPGHAGTFSVPIHKDLGIVRLDALNIGLDTGKGLGLEMTLDFAIKFGTAVVIAITGMGTSLSARKRTEEPVNGGVLGYDLSPSFVPPSGAGIVIDAGIVQGGGYLFFDNKKGEYFGTMELEVKGRIALKAIGIIRTRDNQGKNLFSLIILVTAEFQPMQLGFGFTLNGVGGLLALNRTANVQFLQEGITSNVLESILFPKNVVANMNRIMSDLVNAFPIAQNHFVVGLMAKIAWGSPAKVTADIGILLDLPDTRILLVGVLRANFPSEKNAILKLKAGFLGVLDFKNQFIYFRADLIDSRILTFRLTGSWVLGISWGEPSVFVLSAGGFNPRFKEIPKLPGLPNAFNKMQRIGIQLLDSDNPRLLVEAYFAVTSNTVQFGGKAEFFYDVFWDYNIYGKIEVHALFQFSPFYFVFDIDVKIGLLDGKSWVMGIWVNGTLEGPTPWHLKATATAKMPWYLPDIEVSLDKKWGSSAPSVPAETARVLEQVRAAVLDVRNWNTTLPDAHAAHVRFRKPNDASGGETPSNAAALRLAPNGKLRFSQSIVPLDMTLQKFGEQLPDVNLFTIQPLKIGTSNVNGNPARELFSADMFIKMTTDQKLSRPSFENMKSGFEVADLVNSLQIGAVESIMVTGEISDVNSRNMAAPTAAVNLNPSFRRMVKSSSGAYKATAAAENNRRRGGYSNIPTATKDQYVVATRDDLTNHFSGKTFSSYAEAEDERRKQPITLRSRLQVIEAYELV